MAIPAEDYLTLGSIVINVILTLILFSVYLKNYKAIKSKYTTGLLFFSIIFLIENVIDFFLYTIILEQQLYGLTTFITSVNILELIGLLLLTYITWK